MGIVESVHITHLYANYPNCPSGGSIEYPIHTLAYTVLLPPANSYPSKSRPSDDLYKKAQKLLPYSINSKSTLKFIRRVVIVIYAIFLESAFYELCQSKFTSFSVCYTSQARLNDVPRQRFFMYVYGSELLYKNAAKWLLQWFLQRISVS